MQKLTLLKSAVTAMFAFTACVSTATASEITVGISSDVATMEPNGSGADSNLSVMANIFDGLLQRNSDGKLIPSLATDWERIDALTWRFTLRQGVKFHNGNDFTVDDVLFTFNRLNNPEISNFVNFGAQVDSIKPLAGNPWVIDIKTHQPVAFFSQNLPQIFMMDKESTEDRSPGDVGQNPIGTGAYKLAEWIKGSHVVLTANDNYWAGAPAMDKVTIRPVTEASTALASIMSGAVDILQDVPVSSIKVIERNKNLEVLKRPARRSIFLGLSNAEDHPGSDVRVRQAISMAINEEQIIDKVMFGAASLAAQVPDPATIGYNPDIKRPAFNPSKAKALLKDAGYSNGFEITLTGPNDRYIQDEQILAAVAADLAKVGIRVNVAAKPKSIVFKELQENKLEFYLFGWFDGSYDYGRSFDKLVASVDSEKGTGGWNGAAYSNAALDKMIRDSAKIIDVAKREKALQALNLASQESFALIPLHYQMDVYAITKNAKFDFKPRPDTWLIFKEIGNK
ncbi:MAG: ABC transporter substrate-binding protein [Marinomonas sp.]